MSNLAAPALLAAGIAALVFGPDGTVAALGATLVCVAAIIVLPALFDRLVLTTDQAREEAALRRRAFERVQQRPEDR